MKSLLPLLLALAVGFAGGWLAKPSGQPAPSEPGVAARAAAAPAAEAYGPEVVNINLATDSQLQTIPGIGPVLAGRIVEYRAVYGPFSSVEELVNVKGIGEKTLEKMRPYITV